MGKGHSWPKKTVNRTLLSSAKKKGQFCLPIGHFCFRKDTSVTQKYAHAKNHFELWKRTVLSSLLNKKIIMFLNVSIKVIPFVGRDFEVEGPPSWKNHWEIVALRLVTLNTSNTLIGILDYQFGNIQLNANRFGRTYFRV